MKYITRIGQNTGMLKASKHVHTNATTIAFSEECLEQKKVFNKHWKQHKLTGERIP